MSGGPITTVVGNVTRHITAGGPVGGPPIIPPGGGGGGPPPGGGKKDPSEFESAIASLDPDVHLQFREPHFNNRVRDTSGNGRHLLKQLAAATRSAIPTRTTHPGGAYFPSVTFDNWATLGTFYKRAAESLLSGATEFTMLMSIRMITRATGTDAHKLFGVGTENVASAAANFQALFEDMNPTEDVLRGKASQTGGGLIPRDSDVTGTMADGVNRLLILRSNGAFLLTSSKPGHENLTEQTGTAISALATQSKPTVMNARQGALSGSSVTTGYVVDQAAIWESDIGTSAAADLHSKWMAEVAGAGYYPSMMQFDGSTGYYSLTADIDVSAGFTIAGRFKWDGGNITAAGGFNRMIVQALGSSGTSKISCSIVNDETGDDRAGRLTLFVQNAAGTALVTIYGTTIVSDGEEHTFFVAYDPVAGTAVIHVDEGADEINTGATGHTLTTGTIETGSGNITVGARAVMPADRFFDGLIGPVGVGGSHLTNHEDFMDGNLPKPIDEKDWTEWGAQPLFWSHTGQMDNSKGSAGDMTKNGTITMTEGGSP